MQGEGNPDSSKDVHGSDVEGAHGERRKEPEKPKEEPVDIKILHIDDDIVVFYEYDGHVHMDVIKEARGPDRRHADNEETEPMVDVVEYSGEVWVIADLPGVDKDKINIDATESAVTISAEVEERRYRKVVELPAPVDPNSAVATYKNGILEIKLKKRR